MPICAAAVACCSPARRVQGVPVCVAEGEVPACEGTTVGVFWRARAGGCFGIRSVAGLAHCSYKSKNFFAEGKQPLLLLDEPPLSVDADHATNDQAGGAVDMGTRAVLVAVRDCDFHGERVAEASALARGARVRVWGAGWARALRRCSAGIYLEQVRIRMEEGYP